MSHGHPAPLHRRRPALRLFTLAIAWLPALALAFDAQGHRGARGLAPENTLPAFERALGIGVHTLELDLGVTADNEVVISHDRALNPAFTRDSSGQWLRARGATIRSLTLAQLQAYDVGRIDPASRYATQFPQQVAVDGTRVPTLAALFARVKALGADHVRFNIETKIDPTRPDETANPEQFVRAVLNTVRNAGMVKRVTIQSFDWRTLQIVQGFEPAIPTVYLTQQSASSDTVRDPQWTAGLRIDDYGSVPKMVKAAGGAVWSPNARALTPDLVRESQALGVKVIPWTVNDAADMARLMDWGVDGIITDYPDRLHALMQQRGMALPPAVKP